MAQTAPLPVPVVPRDPTAALIAAVARGDVEAYTSLYDELVGPVYRIACLVLRDGGLAEEVTQEVFLMVWQAASRYNPDRGSVRSWVLTMARRRAVDRVRREQAWRRRNDRFAARADRCFDEVSEIVDAALEGAEVKAALEQLTTLQRQSIVLAYYDGHSYRDVARLLGVPAGTVKARIRDGLTRLRAVLVAEHLPT